MKNASSLATELCLGSSPAPTTRKQLSALTDGCQAQRTGVVVTGSEWPGCGGLPRKVCLQHVNVMAGCWLGWTHVIKEQINA